MANARDDRELTRDRASSRSLLARARIRDWVPRLLVVGAAAYFASAAAVVLTGGYAVRVGKLRILNSADANHDLLFAAMLGAAAAAICGRARTRNACATGLRVIEQHGAWMAIALSVAVLFVGLINGTNCPCGSDSYGYVSEASLWANGTLQVPEPLARVVHWPRPEWTLAPIGYRPAMRPGFVVPSYAAGLPLVMAVAIKLARTRDAAFVVVPVFGALAIWCTFLLGRQMHSAATGLMTASLLACSPTFLFLLIEPMSDLPVTMWWIAAAVLAFRGTRRSAFFAGLACAAAILTRPNLVPLTIVFVPVVLFAPIRERVEADGWHRLALFVAGVLPGPMLVALIQRSLYGSPLTSGYGDLGPLFSLSNAVPNVHLYAEWLSQTHGPWLAVAALAPFVWFLSRYVPAPGLATADRRSPPAGRTSIADPRMPTADSIVDRASPTAGQRSTAGRRSPTAATVVIWFSVAFFVLLSLLYLFYAQFDNWTYTRFLLPALPFVIAIGVWALRTLVHSSTFGFRRLASDERSDRERPSGYPTHSSTAECRRPIAHVALLFAFALVAIDWSTRARLLGVFDTKTTEQRYIAVARFVDATTPKDTIIIGVQHTGATHYYANRETVRYDWVERQDLDPIIREIQALGRGPLIVVDDWEEEVVRKRFAGQQWGALDWPPRAELEIRPIGVRIFDPADRARYRAGKLVEPTRIDRNKWLR